MMALVLMVAHIAVLGYWLGSELVINSNFRYVCHRQSLPVQERNALLQHVMDVDQHVRFALVMQFSLGFALAFLLGYLPGGAVAAWAMLGIGMCWLLLVEYVHRVRHAGSGAAWARFDRTMRYVLMLGLFAMSLYGLGFSASDWPIWLALKMMGFAAVMACGVGIRLVLRDMQPAWQELMNSGSTPQLEQQIRRYYWRSTSVLLGLWAFIFAMVLLSILKPA